MGVRIREKDDADASASDDDDLSDIVDDKTQVGTGRGRPLKRQIAFFGERYGSPMRYGSPNKPKKQKKGQDGPPPAAGVKHELRSSNDKSDEELPEMKSSSNTEENYTGQLCKLHWSGLDFDQP